MKGLYFGSKSEKRNSYFFHFTYKNHGGGDVKFLSGIVYADLDSKKLLDILKDALDESGLTDADKNTIMPVSFNLIHDKEKGE